MTVIRRFVGASRAVRLAVAALLAAPAAVTAQDLGLEVGTQAPAAAVTTLDGKPANLSQYVGKAPTVIEFWATWCSNCKELEPTLRAAQKKYAKDVKFVTVAVSVNQTPARVRAHKDKHGLTGDVYFDTKGDASGAYDAPATSYVVILDRTGKVVYTGLGGKQDIDGGIRKALSSK
jgi:thiol-disulfide isomerase/thioredoxin